MFKPKNNAPQYKCTGVSDPQGKLISLECTEDKPVQSHRHHESDGTFVRCFGKNEYIGTDPNVIIYCKLYNQHGKHVGKLHVTLINNGTSIQHHAILNDGSWFKEGRLVGNDLTATIPINATTVAAFPLAAPWQGNPACVLFLGLDSHTDKQPFITVWKGNGNEVFENTHYIEARCPYIMNVTTGKLEYALGCHFWFSTKYPEKLA